MWRKVHKPTARQKSVLFKSKVIEEFGGMVVMHKKIEKITREQSEMHLYATKWSLNVTFHFHSL